MIHLRLSQVKADVRQTFALFLILCDLLFNPITAIRTAVVYINTAYLTNLITTKAFLNISMNQQYLYLKVMVMLCERARLALYLECLES